MTGDQDAGREGVTSGVGVGPGPEERRGGYGPERRRDERTHSEVLSSAPFPLSGRGVPAPFPLETPGPRLSPFLLVLLSHCHCLLYLYLFIYIMFHRQERDVLTF